MLAVLMKGHARFCSGRRITRDLARQSSPITETQAPLAVVVSCIDSRAPVELIFDLGLGDIFSVRVAGNIAGPMVLGSVEYACAVASARLVLVLGHTRCGAVTSAVELRSAGADPDQVAAARVSGISSVPSTRQSPRRPSALSSKCRQSNARRSLMRSAGVTSCR